MEEKKQTEELDVEKLKEEIERLKKELEKLRSSTEEKHPEELISKETVIKILDETENLIKKTFSVLEGAIIGAIEGAKKNLKE